MSFTSEDLTTATAKLSTLEFTANETAAIASFLSAESDSDTTDSDVAGFGFDPNNQDRGQGFLLEVAGLMTPQGRGFSFGVEREFRAPGTPQK